MNTYSGSTNAIRPLGSVQKVSSRAGEFGFELAIFRRAIMSHGVDTHNTKPLFHRTGGSGEGRARLREAHGFADEQLVGYFRGILRLRVTDGKADGDTHSKGESWDHPRFARRRAP